MAWSKKYSPACNRLRGWRRAYTSNANALRMTPFCFSNRATVLLDAPCGRSTNTPWAANAWYGPSMLYHAQAATPATASNNITETKTPILFNSASSLWVAVDNVEIHYQFCLVCAVLSNIGSLARAKVVTLPYRRKAIRRTSTRLDVLWVAFCRVPLLQVFLQDYGRSHGVDRGSGVARTFGVGFRFVQYPSGLLLEQAFRFPTGEAFVEHVHRQAQLLAQTRGKSRGFFRHFAARSRKQLDRKNTRLNSRHGYITY